MKSILLLIRKPIFVVFSILIFQISCEKEMPELVNEEEVITTVVLNLIDETGASQSVRWFLNPAVSNQASVDPIVLKANTKYTVSVNFLNESDPTNPQTITADIVAEADDHQVFYEFTGNAISLSTSSSDTVDSENNPLYLTSIWSTGTEASSGQVRIYLIHLPTSKSGQNRTDFGGETDVSADFPFQITL